jgi:hypothetical protein
MSARVELQLDGRGLGTIAVDGHDLTNAANGIEIVSRAGHPTTVKLSLVVVGQLLTANLAADVQLDEDTLALLDRLGWTPPEPAGGQR